MAQHGGKRIDGAGAVCYAGCAKPFAAMQKTGRVGSHVLKRGDTLTDFMTRAILNQLENEGDLEIRALIEEENEMEEL